MKSDKEEKDMNGTVKTLINKVRSFFAPKELFFGNVKFNYLYKVDIKIFIGFPDSLVYKKYGFKYVEEINEKRSLYKRRWGAPVLMMYMSVPCFDSGDYKWDSYRKLFIYRSFGELIGVLMSGGYRIANITVYHGLKCRNEKEIQLLRSVGIMR